MRRECFITPVSCMSPRSHSDLIYDSLYSFIRDIHPPASATHTPFTSEDALILTERERDGWMSNAGLNETKARLLLLNYSAFTTVCGFNYAETRGGEEMPHRAKDRHWENEMSKDRADERGELDHWQMCEVMSLLLNTQTFRSRAV